MHVQPIGANSHPPIEMGFPHQPLYKAVMNRYLTVGLMCLIGSWRLGLTQSTACTIVSILLWELPYLSYTTGAYVPIYERIYAERLSVAQQQWAHNVKTMGWLVSVLLVLMLTTSLTHTCPLTWELCSLTAVIVMATMILYYAIIAKTLH